MVGTGKYRQIVDENDVLIGHKWKEQFDPAKDIYRISALWLRNEKDQILLAQRAPDIKNGGGKWGPAVAGTLEHDETYEENIVKETHEEIGLSNLKLTPGKKRYVESDGRKYFAIYFYGKVSAHEPQPSAHEDKVAAVKWVDETWLVNDVAEHPELYVRGMADNIQEIINDCRE